MFGAGNVNDDGVYDFAKKVSREKRIPFDVCVDPFYSESNMRYLEKMVHDVQSGQAHFAEHELIEGDE